MPSDSSAPSSDPLNSFANRLEKKYRHLFRWARRARTSAYRLYDRDIPQFPFTVDWFDGRILLVEYPRHPTKRASESESLIGAVAESLGVPPNEIYRRVHEPKRWGHEQYGKLSDQGEDFVVEESGLKFWVNLSRYLDAGLFLDHRITRSMIRAEARQKRVLNLFSYTGSFSVYAAAGGADATVSVDLSKTYLAWAKRNFMLNGLSTVGHELIKADARQWVVSSRGRVKPFDIIILDPPSYSSSKSMSGTLDVQRDHVRLIEGALALLTDRGALYLSTNYQAFKLDYPKLKSLNLLVDDITRTTIPADFRNPKVHQCWRIRRTT